MHGDISLQAYCNINCTSKPDSGYLLLPLLHPLPIALLCFELKHGHKEDSTSKLDRGYQPLVQMAIPVIRIMQSWSGPSSSPIKHHGASWRKHLTIQKAS
jgi:hypothetical protein